MACQVYIRILTILVIGAVVHAQVCNQRGYAVCRSQYNTTVNRVTDANRKCIAYNKLVLCARSVNCLVNPNQIPNQCSTGSVVHARICNQRGYAVCRTRYNTTVNRVTDANRKCIAYNNLVFCARSVNCLVNPNQIPNQCSTGNTCKKSAYNVCKNIHSVATKFTSDEDTLCTAYRALVVCAIAANCVYKVDADDNPCPPPCNESDYTPCETTYTNAISGVSINNTENSCSAYTALVACASDVNCEDNIRVTNPCSTGTPITGSIILVQLLFSLQLFKNN